MPTDLPPAPAEEEQRDACCGECSSMFHSTTDHPPTLAGVASLMGPPVVAGDDWRPGYDPAEADRLIGRDPQAATSTGAS